MIFLKGWEFRSSSEAVFFNSSYMVESLGKLEKKICIKILYKTKTEVSITILDILFGWYKPRTMMVKRWAGNERCRVMLHFDGQHFTKSFEETEQLLIRISPDVEGEATCWSSPQKSGFICSVPSCLLFSLVKFYLMVNCFRSIIQESYYSKKIRSHALRYGILSKST